jgi:hypothetical protein
VAADLNADGREDLALPLFIANRLAVFLQPDLGFQDASRPDLEPGDGSLRLRHPSDLVAEDLDGDGLLDLACSSLGGIGSLNVAVFFQRSRGRFSDAPDLDLGGAEGRDEGYMALAAADLNSDGEPDIAAALQRFADPSGSEGPSDVIHLFFGGK